MMGHVLSFMACLAAFSALALATERQQGDLFGRPLAARATWALRAAGWGRWPWRCTSSCRRRAGAWAS